MKKSFKKKLEALDKEDLINLIEDMQSISLLNYNFLLYNLHDSVDSEMNRELTDSYLQSLSNMFSLGNSLQDYSFVLKDIKMYLNEHIKILHGDRLQIYNLLKVTLEQLTGFVSQKKVLVSKNLKWTIILYEDILNTLNSLGTLSQKELNEFDKQLKRLELIENKLYEILNYKLYYNKKGT